MRVPTHRFIARSMCRSSDSCYSCYSWFLILAVMPLSLALSLRAAEITAERSPHGVIVQIDGQPFTEYLTQSGTKPVLWPIIGPTGKPMTRPWPIEGKPQLSKDHPHHRSLWFSHGSVNGIDFWTEPPLNKKRTGPAKTGSIVHRDFTKIKSGPVAEIVATDDWLSPQGKKVCEDVRGLVFGTEGGTRWIDYTITIRASEGPVKFGDTKEGAFGLRVPDSIRVDSKKGGQIVNSRGQTDGDAWGKPAEWVDYHGPLDGQTVGIAILNHPGSFRYPARWHVRTYGLFAANPFADHEFDGDTSHPVSYTLPQGKELVLRYRILLHRGDEKQGRVAEAFAEYAKAKCSPLGLPGEGQGVREFHAGSCTKTCRSLSISGAAGRIAGVQVVMARGCGGLCRPSHRTDLERLLR